MAYRAHWEAEFQPLFDYSWSMETARMWNPGAKGDHVGGPVPLCWPLYWDQRSAGTNLAKWLTKHHLTLSWGEKSQRLMTLPKISSQQTNRSSFPLWVPSNLRRRKKSSRSPLALTSNVGTKIDRRLHPLWLMLGKGNLSGASFSYFSWSLLHVLYLSLGVCLSEKSQDLHLWPLLMLHLSCAVTLIFSILVKL